MRIFLALLICSSVGYFSYNIYSYGTRTGELSGYVFIEKDKKLVVPVKDLPVFLIRKTMKQDVEAISERYQPLLDSLHKEIACREMVIRELDKLQAQEGATQSNDNNNFERYIYGQLQRRLVVLTNDNNSDIGKAIAKHFYQKTQTNSRGNYSFKNIPRNEYYLYAFHGSVKSSFHWFTPVTISGKTQLHLSRKNLGTLFK